ncbi:MAG TPA: class I SAM-dependent methyltransferase [bacterium]|nr:class I SAM-dependent methyltransferase [bacterium]
MLHNTATDKFSQLYWDLENRRPLTPGEGCPLDQWLTGRTEARFAIHPAGFLVFLPPDQLEGVDEYRAGDPYAAEEGFVKWPAFQNRRLATTLKLLEKALASVSGTPAILDVACGEGIITAEIKKQFGSAEVCGIDYSISAITTAASLHSGVEFAVGDARRLPYCPGRFDAVVLNNIWEHLPDPLNLLEGVKRILKPGGYAIISTPSRYRFRNMVRVVLGLPVEFMSKEHVTEYTVGQVLEQLRYAGMEAELFDEPLRGPAGGLVRFIAFKMAVPIVRAMLQLIGSHHSPEETVFYLAHKQGWPAEGSSL